MLRENTDCRPWLPAHRFIVGSPLGSGSSAVVYRAKAITSGGDVALKVLHDRLRDRATARARLAREASVAAAIGSSHVPAIIDTMSSRSTPFIAMERLVGETLAERLATVGHVAPERFVTTLDDLCAALDDVHQAGFVHRDVKPSNIFIEEHDKRIRLIDFGVTCRRGARDQPVGTPSYMSPERICGTERAASASDLWSVGVIAFECMTGRRPFSGISLPQVLAQVVHGHIPTITECAPRLANAALDAWFRRVMSRDPSRRFRSARELCESFVAAVG